MAASAARAAARAVFEAETRELLAYVRTLALVSGGARETRDTWPSRGDNLTHPEAMRQAYQTLRLKADDTLMIQDSRLHRESLKLARQLHAALEPVGADVDNGSALPADIAPARTVLTNQLKLCGFPGRKGRCKGQGHPDCSNKVGGVGRCGKHCPGVVDVIDRGGQVACKCSDHKLKDGPAFHNCMLSERPLQRRQAALELDASGMCEAPPGHGGYAQAHVGSVALGRSRAAKRQRVDEVTGAGDDSERRGARRGTGGGVAGFVASAGAPDAPAAPAAPAAMLGKQAAAPSTSAPAGPLAMQAPAAPPAGPMRARNVGAYFEVDAARQQPLVAPVRWGMGFGTDSDDAE